MALYSYKKKSTGFKRKSLVFISYTSMTIGALFLFWSFYPVLASHIYSEIFINRKVMSPIPIVGASDSINKAQAVKGSDNKFSTNLIDYTRASNWFVSSGSGIQSGLTARSDIKEYTISIPKIGIENARVIVGGDDLLSGIIHYLPETLPGEDGIVSLFGHSSLLSLYKDNDYEHIFSYIPFLENGDRIHITIDTVTYTYEVFNKMVVKPDQIDVLTQRYDNSYLNLITCLPHGTYINRGVVQAKLVSLPLN